MSSRVARGFAWNHVYKMVEYGLINLYSIVVVRKFGPELAGGYAVYIAICNTLAIIAAFGVDGVLLRYLPRVAQGEREIGSHKIGGIRQFVLELFGFRLAVATIMSAGVAIFLGVLPMLLPGFGQSLGSLYRLWPYLVLFLMSQAAVAFSTFTLIGLLQVKWVFFASLISRVALLSAGLLIVFASTLTLESAVAVHAFAALLNALLLLWWLHVKVTRAESQGVRHDVRHLSSRVWHYLSKPGRSRAFLLTPFMLYGITTWGSDLLSTVLGRQPDILMMRAMLGENVKDIGLYQSAAQLVLMAEYVFLFGLGGTLVSVFSELVHKDESASPGSVRYARLRQARIDIAGFQTVVTAPVFAFMLVFAPIVVEALYGPKFLESAPMVRLALLLISTSVIGFGGGMQVTSLVVIGKERLVFRNRLLWGIINLILNYFLIRSWGGVGAMFGTQFCNSAACVTESFFAARFIGASFEWKRTVIVAFVVSCAAAISYLLASHLGGLPVLIRVVVIALSMGVLTVLGYLAFRLPDARKIVTRLMGLLSRKPSAQALS